MIATLTLSERFVSHNDTNSGRTVTGAGEVGIRRPCGVSNRTDYKLFLYQVSLTINAVTSEMLSEDGAENGSV